jgi:CRP/FNR family transcriptional regulator, cyclic AMP receptor protein
MSIAVDPRSASVKAMQLVAPRPWSSNTRFETRLTEKSAFDVQAFLCSTGVARKVVEYGGKETVFTQGDHATSVLYIQLGGVKLAVDNEVGKEAVLAILGPGDLFGEECLVGQPQRLNTAATITPSTIVVIEKPEMVRLLHARRALCDRFIKHSLSRNIRVEEELINQLLNSAEKRLARTLLQLARYGRRDKPERMVPGIS